MSWYNFWNKTEKRDVNVKTLSLTEQNTDAIGLIFGKNRMENYARNLSAVYRATNLIAESLASLPLLMYKKDSSGMKIEYTTHPVYNLLLNKPNPFMTAHDMVKCWATDLMLLGNAYGIIHRDINGKVSQIEYVSAKKVTITKKYGSEGELTKVLYNINGRKRMLEDWEIIHIKQNLSEDGIEGESILKYASRTLKLCNYNESAVENSYANGGRLSGIISVAGALTNKQREDMKQAWTQSLGGTNSGSVAVMSGIQKYETISQNNEELELLKSREFNVSEIARFWGVSPILLYDLNHSNYSSADAAHLHLLTDTLTEYIYKIESELENKLFTPAELNRCEIKFDVTQFLRADTKTQLENLRTGFNLGIYSVNEMRSALDLPAIEDGDEHYLQSQLVTLANSKHLAEQQISVMDNNSKPKDMEDEKEDEKEDSEESQQVQEVSSTGDTKNSNEE